MAVSVWAGIASWSLSKKSSDSQPKNGFPCSATSIAERSSSVRVTPGEEPPVSQCSVFTVHKMFCDVRHVTVHRDVAMSTFGQDLPFTLNEMYMLRYFVTFITVNTNCYCI